MPHAHLQAPYRVGWDVPVSDWHYNYCKNVLGLNVLCGLSLSDSTQAQIDNMWALADKYDLYIILWALFDPAVRETLIKANKDEAHLFGWFLWDEVDGQRTKEQQMTCHDEVRGYDPDHPTIMIWNWGETWNWEPNAFEILTWAMYSISNPPEDNPLAPVIETLYMRMTNGEDFYNRHLLIRESIAMGKPFFPFMDAHSQTVGPPIPDEDPAPWCSTGPDGTGGVIISGERTKEEGGDFENYLGQTEYFSKYNGMYGLKAVYLCWEDLAGGPGSMDGACFYNYQYSTHPCKAEINKQIRDICHTYLSAPFPLSGGLSFEKSLTADLKYRKVYKFIAGSLTMSKSLVKSLFYPLSGSVSSSGSLKKLLYSALSGVLSLSGDLDTPFWETIKKNVSGSLTFTSTLTHKIVKKLLGLITYGKYKYSDLNNLLWSQLETLTWDQLQSFDAGSLTKKVKLALAGGMVDGFAPRGCIMGKTPSLRACEKTWSFIQTLTWTQFQEYFWCKHILYVRSLGGGVGMSGTPGRHLQKPLSGSFDFNPTENLFMKVKPVLSSALSSTGVAKRLIHFLTIGVSNLTGSPKIKALLTASGGINLYGKVSTGVGALRKLLYKLIQLIERHGV